MNPYYKRWCWVVLFAMAFAWVESAVVVYLRDIFFDGNFSFPLVVQWEGDIHVVNPLIKIEFGREIATIIMLIAIGWVSGRNSIQKFSFFMIAFGIWDIFYYVWLRVMVGWPESLFTWDLLFYVPLPWVGPVITPVLIALTMTAAGTALIVLDENGIEVRWRWFDLVVEFFFALLLIISFCLDWKNIIQMSGDPSHTGIPNPFAWWLYTPALLLSILYFCLRLKHFISANENGGRGCKKEK